MSEGDGKAQADTTEGPSGTATLDQVKVEETARPTDAGATAASEPTEDDRKGPFGFSARELMGLVDPKSKELLDKMGGSEALCRGLLVDPSTGLKSDEKLPTKDILSSPGAAGGTAAVSEGPFAERSAVFGRNVLPELKAATLLQLIWLAFHDKILILLCVAAFLSLAIGLYQDFGMPKDPNELKTHWVEGFAIMIAVMIVVLVSSINDYQKEQQFRKLNAKKEDRQARVVRDGVDKMISVFDIQVGDVMTLEPGDLLPVDGVVLTSHNLKLDESSATGESDLIRKQAYSNDASCKDPFILSGSKVSEGVGRFIVTAVGTHSFNGKTMMGLRVETEDTPLQIKLDHLAENIAKIGASASLLLLIILLIKYLVVEAQDNSWPSGPEIAQNIVNIFIQSIIVIVVAVPEGLPLAVTLALAYGTRRMLDDNNLVRVLAACETMGGATTICSDKTGTLTQNKMTVVTGVLGFKLEFKENSGIKKVLERFQSGKLLTVDHPDTAAEYMGEVVDKISPKQFLDALLDGIAINSTAFEEKDQSGQVQFIGSKTENALIEWARKLGQTDFVQVRHNNTDKIVQVFPFSSERKSMTTVIKVDIEGKTVYRVFTKGASEIVLRFCKNIAVVAPSGTALDIVALNENIRKRLLLYIADYANQSLRTICMAYCDIPESSFFEIVGGQAALETLSETEAALRTDKMEKYVQKNMTCMAIVGIEDPLREGVPEAVRKCQKAGVFVRMVTGDNISTARAIASKCGILMKGGLAMEGRVFRQLPKQEMMDILPKLQVLARSSPLDKQILVETLKEMGETVAVTGDGTNDGPALRMADIGFSMGIAGTEVAKEASSIILMDDNFSSIVKAMMWGRSVNDSVKKFLQFQLTVNVSAVLIAFFSAVFDSDNKSVLTALQLLWINLMMDSLAALALATDPPTDEILNRYPESKKSPLITVQMWKMILGQAAFQVVVSFLIINLWTPVTRLPVGVESKKLLGTFVFNTFVYFQLFNEVNCRRIDSNLNIFFNIHKNYYFIVIFFGSVLVQAILVEFGGYVFSTVHMPGMYWLISILIGFLTLPIGVIIRLLPTWDGCTICGKPIAVPDNSRVVMTRERLAWQSSITKVRSQLSVFRALRGRASISAPSSPAPGTASSSPKKDKKSATNEIPLEGVGEWSSSFDMPALQAEAPQILSQPSLKPEKLS